MKSEVFKLLDEPSILREFAVGNDLVFLPDFETTFNGLFRDKVYTQTEIDYCDSFSEPLLRYASTWAAKEAVYKAVKQVQQSSFGPKSIEIIRTKPAGPPSVKILKYPLLPVSLTITHDGEYVWAIALIKRTES
jgi:holo-[acyl-carrier protein] synthase